MTATPLFDGCTHPTLDGTWLREADGAGNTFENLAREMEANGVSHALAHGLGLGGYDEEAYASAARSCSDRILPIAYFDPERVPEPDDVGPWLQHIRQLGYVGFKIHPRLASLTYTDERLPPLLAGAKHAGLAPLLCTYAWTHTAAFAENTIENLGLLLAQVPEAKVILVHAGGVRLLEFVELARAHPGVLLDLSLTLTKYEGSSIDLDLAFCFQRFDRRICMGSDSPEVSLAELRRRFEHFAEGLTQEKRTNIAHANLERFLGL